MNYKIIEYMCGCKYIWILDPDKVILPHQSKCPKHKKNQISITLWCADCGLKVVAIPLAGWRQKVCHKCGAKRQRENSKKWNARHPNYFKVNTTDKHRTVELTETQEQKDIRHFKEWFRELQERFKPSTCYHNEITGV